MFCNLNSPKIFTCLLGKLRTEFISRMENCTCPRLSDTTFFACWKSGREVKIISALWLLIIPQKPLSRCSIITSAPAHVLCINKEVIFIGSLSYRLQNSPYIFAYSSAREQSKTLTPRFTDFFTDFEEKTDCFAVHLSYFSWIKFLVWKIKKKAYTCIFWCMSSWSNTHINLLKRKNVTFQKYCKW